MIARLAGEITAAPMPCSARAPSSIPWSWAIAQTSEETPNRPIPARKTRRRPSRSEARPPSSRKPAKVRVYALTTHCRPVSENPSPSWIDGRATLTIETSRMTMNWARQITTSNAVERLIRIVRWTSYHFVRHSSNQ